MKLAFGGINSVLSALRAKPEEIQEAWIARNVKGERIASVRMEAMAAKVQLRVKNREELDKAAGHKSHQGVLCWCEPPAGLPEKALLERCETSKPAGLLVLEGVTDPRNLGACLRSAEACGATAVVVSSARSVWLTPAAIRVAAGSAHRMPLVRAKNMARMIRQLKESGICVVGLHPAAEHSLYEFDCRRSVAFVLGSEGDGMRRLTAELCDYHVSVPMYGEVESLNVSVTAALCMYEMCRQRGWQRTEKAGG